MGNGKKSIFDPRAGLWILIAANIIAFSDHTLWVELALVALLLALMVVHRRLQWQSNGLLDIAPCWSFNR